MYNEMYNDHRRLEPPLRFRLCVRTIVRRSADRSVDSQTVRICDPRPENEIRGLQTFPTREFKPAERPPPSPHRRVTPPRHLLSLQSGSLRGMQPSARTLTSLLTRTGPTARRAGWLSLSRPIDPARTAQLCRVARPARVRRAKRGDDDARRAQGPHAAHAPARRRARGPGV